ncbi:hypothetical protein PPACK8108_LOCUS7948 [Phakopsora pachyrhizi]|uniref:Uncharacterized protein n=1 Tax=Phakopsora pachyrhizi TaxID=170000 RepID=A0AAV0ATV7_PHAPC|nr:hypothetical protein PPACK8108_LOCUS5763 [Phakopsora pachyrhizi]CAH7673088.1 hypothetical protein PPACK8108_LOCUS7948 [Phakopsora pachyrhizi]
MIPPSVRPIISFLLVFTVGSRISFRNLFTGTFPFIIVISIPSIPITFPLLIKSIEPYTRTPPTFSFFFLFISEL